MDRRLAARVDPSDVVQDALAEADRRLTDYLVREPLPFYPWLRRLALDRLGDLYRHHIRAGKRSVRREEEQALPDESALELARRLLAPGSSPSKHLLRKELHARVRQALHGLTERDREVLVLRHLEHLSVRQTAEVLGLTEGAVKSRHLRAVERLRGPGGENARCQHGQGLRQVG
jgi:RNA polymerase sigma-70 factor (ECF subfamily)